MLATEESSAVKCNRAAEECKCGRCDFVKGTSLIKEVTCQ